MQQVEPRYHLNWMIKDHISDKVYLAEDKHLDRQVLIRMFQIAEDANNGALKEKISYFEHEIKAIAGLDHPSILSPTDYYKRTRDGETQFSLVMPYRPEGSLHDWVQENGSGGRLQLNQVKNFVREAVDALQYIHEKEDIYDQKMFHGNVKPSQFLVHPHKGKPNLPNFQLSGLGVATFRSTFLGADQTFHEAVAYKAPEQKNGSISAADQVNELNSPVAEQKNGNISAAADQYALAVIIYELITGHLPIEDPSVQPSEQHSHASTFWFPRITSQLQRGAKRIFASSTRKMGEVNSSNSHTQVLDSRFEDEHLPKELGPVLQKALNEDPQKRYRTISEFGNAFCHPEEKKSSSQKQPLRSWVAGLVLYFLITLVLLYVIGNVLNALNKLPAIIIILTSSLGSSLTTLGGFGSGIITGAGATFFTRISKGLKRPFIIVTTTVLSIVTVGLLFFELSTQVSVITDPYTHQGIAVYGDHLVNNSQDFQWYSGVGKTGSCLFKNGAYDVLQKEGNFTQDCVANARNFNDFIYEIQMKIIRGSCGGIIIRESSYFSNNRFFNNNNYFFRICSNGSYDFLSYVKGNLVQVLSTGNSPYIETGLANSNIIAVVARGSAFSLYANGMVLDAHITDSTYSDGHIGVFASRGSEVIFSNARLWPI